MKPSKISQVLITLLIFFQICIGQEKPKAELISELGTVGGCEYYWSSIDVLLTKLVDETESVGYIVLSGNKDNVIQTIKYREWVDGHLKLRKLSERFRDFNDNRLLVVRGKDSGDFKIQIWKVSNSAEKPFDFNSKFEYSLPIKDPVNLSDFTFDAGGLCPYLDTQKIFIDLLRANPNLRGNIVVHRKPLLEFRKEKEAILKDIKDISPTRLRIFHSKQDSLVLNEFWLVPTKK